MPYLQCRHEVCRLQQRKLANLVHDRRNLGVCRCRGIGRLPSLGYPLLCEGGCGAEVRGVGLGGADAAPEGARNGSGHVDGGIAMDALMDGMREQLEP